MSTSQIGTEHTQGKLRDEEGREENCLLSLCSHPLFVIYSPSSNTNILFTHFFHHILLPFLPTFPQLPLIHFSFPFYFLSLSSFLPPSTIFLPIFFIVVPCSHMPSLPANLLSWQPGCCASPCPTRAFQLIISHSLSPKVSRCAVKHRSPVSWIRDLAFS